jgi:HlyD family secretion protein
MATTTTDNKTLAPPISTSSARKPVKKKPFPWLIVTVVVLVAAGIGWWIWSANQAASDASEILTTQVTTGNLTETVSATGSVTAQTGAEVAIGAQVTGVVKHLYADVGSVLKAGQLIAELDLPDTQDQLDEAQSAASAAAVKYAQTITQTAPEVASTEGAISQAQSTVSNDQANLAVANAAYSEQKTDTPTDVQKAQTTLAADVAALASAQTALTQTQQGADLNVQTAQQQLTQAKATAANSAISLQRQQQLLAQGFVPQSTVDQAVATNSVNQSLVSAAQENLTLTQQRVAASLPTAQNAVVQAQQAVAGAKAALLAARAESNTTSQKDSAVAQARAVLAKDQSALTVAQSNIAQNTVQQQNVMQAKEAMLQAQQAVNYNQVQVAKSYIRTPISGTVIQLSTEQGETLDAGLSSPTLIVVADLTRLQVDAFVDETDIGKIKIGQPATVTVDAFPNHTYRGKVVKIASGSTIQEGVVTYDVTISIRDRRRQLKPDMTSEVTILTGQINNVLLVPSVAVNVGVGGSTVSVVTMDGGKQKITPVPVTTGGTDGVNTEITSGLTKGQTIVLASADTGNGTPHGPQNPFAQRKRPGGTGGGGGGGAH